jgi:hypothetical protein
MAGKNQASDAVRQYNGQLRLIVVRRILHRPQKDEFRSAPHIPQMDRRRAQYCAVTTPGAELRKNLCKDDGGARRGCVSP